MKYNLKLYPDQMSKEGIKIIEIEADDATVEELGETVYLNFQKLYGEEMVTVYGVDFSKVVEFYIIKNVLKSEEIGKTTKSLAPKFNLIEFRKETK